MASTVINSIFLGPIWLQSGNGSPDHYGLIGTQYTDLISATQYINKDGLNTWHAFLTSPSGFDRFVTGFTYSNNNLTIKQNDGLSDLSVIVNSMTGLTINGTLSGTTLLGNSIIGSTISATTYQNLPLDVFTTGSTRLDDVVYFNRNDSLSAYTSDAGLSQINNRLLLNDSSTGVISFSGLTFTPSATTFNVGIVKAWFIDNDSNPSSPTKQYVEFPATTGNSLVNLSGQNVTYIGVNSGGTIIQQSTPYHSNQTREIIPLGVIVHSNRIFINAVNNQPIVALSPSNQVSDLITNLGFFNINGNIFGPNGNNLNINKTQGEIFKQGVNFVNNPSDPHTLTLSALTAPNNVRYRLQNSLESSNTSFVDPNFYDLNGVLTPVPDTKYTIQYIFLFQSNLIRIQYGQRYYDSLDDARGGIINDNFIIEANLIENGLLRGFLIVRKNTTNLTNQNEAKFLEVSKFGKPLDTNTGNGLYRKQILNNTSTGLISGGTLSTASTTTFNVSAGSGVIIDNTTNPNNPILTEVFWSGFSGVTVTNLTGQTSTGIFINSFSNIIQLNGSALPTSSDLRDKIQLGLVAHPTGVVSSVYNTPTPIINPTSQINDLTGAMGPFSISGNRITKIIGTLKLLKSAGKSYFGNSNYHIDRTTPSILNVSILSGSTLNYVKQNGFLGPISSDIDTNNYDLNGTVTALPTNDFAAHRIWHQPSNNTLFFQYGQANYTNLDEARSKFSGENFVVPTPLDFGAYLIAVIIVRKGETNLDNSARAEIISQGKFAGTGGGGGGTPQTLQSVYDASISPEIVIDATRGALSIKNGTGNSDLTTSLFEGMSTGGTVTSKVMASGSYSGTSFIKSGGTASQFLKADGSVDLNPAQIRISASTNILTSTLDVNGYGQNGRNTVIDNSTSIILTTDISSEQNFISSYLKHGTNSVTFSAGSGTSLALVDGTNILGGISGSTATLSRVDNIFYLRISNA